MIFHADRGCQDTSGDYAVLASDLAVWLSSGRTGQCWDNALTESFFASLKGECLDLQPWPTRAAARRATVDYIAWDNSTRLHSALGYQTPTSSSPPPQEGHRSSSPTKPSTPSVRPGQHQRTAGRVALGVGLLMAALAVLTASMNREWVPLVNPLVLAAGVAIAAYGGWVVSAAGDQQAPLPVVPPWQRALRGLLVGGVITLALFWEVANFADVVGRGKALEVARIVPTLPRAAAFSATPLGIQAPGVHEERLDVTPDASKDALRYRTTGLRFLVRSGGRMFLLHDGWTPQRGTVIVLPDNEQVRWQFSRWR